MSRRGFPTGLVEDALRSVVGVVKDVVPLDAQLHLLAAQRELILAVAAVIEHRGWGDAGEMPADAAPGGPKRGAKRRPASRRPTRVSLD